ncbi:MAG: hypothetical protein LBG83_07295 [Oscillospiraceae bacterium]|jgi:hypothetical protein|nr:hypothetical protein [Oscillospiraceae bacterium]
MSQISRFTIKIRSKKHTPANRRFAAILALGMAAALLFAACDTGEGMDLRLFCQRYSALSGHARLEPEQFMARKRGEAWQYEAYPAGLWMLTIEARPGGRIQTVALTALPEITQLEFRGAAVHVLSAFCGTSNDAAERWLNEAHAGETETLGWQLFKNSDYQLGYYANEAGRCLRVSELRGLEPPPPTLREPISATPEEIAPRFVPELTTGNHTTEGN